MKTISDAAKRLASKRWSGVSAAERSRIMSGVAKARDTSMTPDERAEVARKAGLSTAKSKRKREILSQ